MAKKRKKKSGLKRISSSSEAIFTLFSRGLIVLIALAAIHLLYKSISNDQYVLQPFQVPGSFEENGNNGVVLVRKIQDKLSEIKRFVDSQKQDDSSIENELKPDLELGIMGVGLSFNTLTYHLKSLFGRENNIITGELTDLDKQMALSIRMTGFEPQNYTFDYQDNRNEALDFLIEEVAKNILKNTDPYRLGVYYSYKKEYSKALKIFVKMIKNDQETKWAYLGWGNLLNKQKKFDLATEKFDKAITIDPKFVLPKQAKAWNYYGKEDFEKAKTAFKDWLKLEPQRSQAWNALAMIHRIEENKEAAIAAYDKAIQFEPDVLWWYNNKADYLLYSLKDTIGAATLFQTIGEKVPDGEDKYYALSGFYQIMNKPDSFLLYTDQLLEINPQNDIVLLQIIFHHSLKEEDSEIVKYEEKVKAINVAKLSERTYRKQRLLNILAISNYQLKNYDKALELIQEAIAIDPDIAIMYTTLAETYGLMGKKTKFYESLELALQKGFALDDLLDEIPYKYYLNEPRFKELARKYKKKENTEPQLVKN